MWMSFFCWVNIHFGCKLKTKRCHGFPRHLVFPNQKSKNRTHLDRTIMQNEKRITVLNIWSFIFCLCFQAVSVSLLLTWWQVLFFCLQMNLVEFAAEKKTKKRKMKKGENFIDLPTFEIILIPVSFISWNLYREPEPHIYKNKNNFQLVYVVIIWFLKNIKHFCCIDI